MARLTPQQFGEKWSNRLQNSTADIERGVMSVTESPMEKAVSKQQKLLQNFTKAVNDGKWANNTRAVSLAQWKQQTLSKGIPRIAGGAQAAQSKMTSFAEKLLPFQDQLASTVNQMPDLTLQDNVNKAVAWINGMAKFRK